MHTISETTTSREARQAAAAARRAARLGQAAAEAPATISEAALATLTDLARREARRIPPQLAARADCDDIAQRAAIRLPDLTVAALDSASPLARAAATREARSALRSIVGTTIRDATGSAASLAALTSTTTTGPLAYRQTGQTLPVRSQQWTRVPLPLVGLVGPAAQWTTSEHQSETDLARAALKADAATYRPDRDAAGQRAYAIDHQRAAGYRAGKAAGRANPDLTSDQRTDLANLAGDVAARHEARSFRTISERTAAPVRPGDAASVRLIREQSLERLLTDGLRVGLDTSRGGDQSGRTLAGILCDPRDVAPAFREGFTILDRLARCQTGRGGSALRTATGGLAGRDWPAEARQAAAEARQAAHAASEARAAAEAARQAASEHRGEGTTRAARAARDAASEAARRANLARSVWQTLTALALDRRPVTLTALVWHCLAASPDMAGRQTSGAANVRTRNGQARDVSTIDTATLLAILTGSPDTTSNAARGLRSALAEAARYGLDATLASPRPSLPLARYRAACARADRERAAEARQARRDAAARSAGQRAAAATRAALAARQPAYRPAAYSPAQRAYVRSLLASLPTGTYAAALAALASVGPAAARDAAQR